MTVKELKDVLDKSYKDDAKVIIVDWCNGRVFEPSIGSDDVDEGTMFCRIGID